MSEPEEAKDVGHCPLCGELNICAMAAGLVDEPCWCSQIEFAPGVLSSVAQEERGERCICPACASGCRR